jgi:hypothetical protein
MTTTTAVLNHSGSTTERVERTGRRRWVPISDMEVSPMAQREYKQWRVDHLLAIFDPEQIGTPVVNHRDGKFFLIDGQHRVAAMKAVGWGDQSVECEVYDGLSEAEEAEMFLKRNDTLAVTAFDKFRIGVRAGRHPEVDVDRIIRSQGLRVARSGPGAIKAPATLVKVYSAHGGAVLTAALGVAHAAYGDLGLESRVVHGLSLMLSRYNDGLVDLERLATQLGGIHLGVDGLIQAAWKIREKSGTAFTVAIAAAAVDAYNQGLASRKRLTSWWRSEGDTE